MTTATTIGTAMAHQGKGSGVEKTYMETTLGFVSTTRVYKREGYSVCVHVCVCECVRACVLHNPTKAGLGIGPTTLLLLSITKSASKRRAK